MEGSGRTTGICLFRKPKVTSFSVGGKLYMESARVEFEVALLTDGWDQTESLLLLFIGCTLSYY